jgi:glycogen synthase
MRIEAMATSFSWLNSVGEYQSLYGDVIARAA